MEKKVFIEKITLQGEEWRFLPESDQYAISSFGRVVSFCKMTPRVLSLVEQKVRGKRYYHVCIHSKKVRVHRIVAKVFVDNPNGYDEVDHINNNSLDNRAANLRWCTHKENMRNPNTIEVHREYSLSHPFEKKGKYPRNVDISVFCNRHEDKMKPVIQIKDGVAIAEFKSLGEAERHGYKKASVSAVINGRLKTYRGCKWVLAQSRNKV